jgi:hypothetical protein
MGSGIRIGCEGPHQAGFTGGPSRRRAGNLWWGMAMRTRLGPLLIFSGEPDKALDELEPLLKMPHYLSPGWLRIDPTFDPLRNNPRFRLVEDTS